MHIELVSCKKSLELLLTCFILLLDLRRFYYCPLYYTDKYIFLVSILVVLISSNFSFAVSRRFCRLLWLRVKDN